MREQGRGSRDYSPLPHREHRIPDRDKPDDIWHGPSRRLISQCLRGEPGLQRTDTRLCGGLPVPAALSHHRPGAILAPSALLSLRRNRWNTSVASGASVQLDDCTTLARRALSDNPSLCLATALQSPIRFHALSPGVGMGRLFDHRQPLLRRSAHPCIAAHRTLVSFLLDNRAAPRLGRPALETKEKN